MAKIGFIGMGNMGYAMLKGVLNVFEPSDIIFTCPDLDKMPVSHMKLEKSRKILRSFICTVQCV